jgi:hypothetical protein
LEGKKVEEKKLQKLINKFKLKINPNLFINLRNFLSSYFSSFKTNKPLALKLKTKNYKLQAIVLPNRALLVTFLF